MNYDDINELILIKKSIEDFISQYYDTNHYSHKNYLTRILMQYELMNREEVKRVNDFFTKNYYRKQQTHI